MKNKHLSQLFTIRIWNEQVGNEVWEWRGKVQHILTGEYIYFHTWGDMIAWLDRFLETQESEEASLPPGEVTPEVDAALL